MRYLVIVDGEHYPPVTEAALNDLAGAGHEVLAAVLAGGQEKLPTGGLEVLGSIAVLAGADPRRVLDHAPRTRGDSSGGGGAVSGAGFPLLPSGPASPCP